MPQMSLSREAVRRVDQLAMSELGMPGIVLMENAARGCVDWLMELGVAGPISVCAGKGNNGGDGLVIARLLENLGFDVRVLLFAPADQLTGDAAINFGVIMKAGSRIVELHDAKEAEIARALDGSAWIVDALLGTGTQGRLRELFASAIRCVNNQPARRFAVDLPSGLDCDSGEPIDDAEHCVRADFTATFVARKLGFDNESAKQFLGDVRVIDIGVPRSFLDRILA